MQSFKAYYTCMHWGKVKKVSAAVLVFLSLQTSCQSPDTREISEEAAGRKQAAARPVSSKKSSTEKTQTENQTAATEDEPDWVSKALNRPRPDGQAELAVKLEKMLKAGEYDQLLKETGQIPDLEKSAKIWYLQALAWENKGNPARAMKDLTAVLLKGDPSVKFFTARARNSLKLNDFKKAVTDATSGIMIDSKYAEAFYVRGKAYSRMGKKEKAEKDYVQARALGLGDRLFLLDDAQRLMGSARYKEALRPLDKLIEKENNNPAYFAMRGECYFRLSQFDNALSDVKKAIDQNPQDEKTRLLRARVLIRQKKYARALKDLNYISENNPDPSALVTSLRGECLQNLGRNQEALAEFNRLVSSSTLKSSALARRATAFYSRGDFDNALADFNRAIRLDPQVDWVYFGRGRTYLGVGDYRKAADDLQKVVERKAVPGNYPDLFLWIARKKGGLNKLADQDIKKLAEKMGDGWTASLLKVYADKISPRECLKRARHPDTRKNREQHCEAYFYLGVYYELKDEKSKAAEFYRKCLENDVKYFVEPPLAREFLNRLQNQK